MRIGMATVLCAVVVSLVAAQSKADGYAVCSDTQTGGTHIQCNSTSCPPGEVLISYNPGKHERCDKPSGGGDYDYRKGAEHCYPARHLKELGYDGGNKTRWCQNFGYDTNTGWYCVRDCSKKCVKAALRDLNWSGKGNKNEFCQSYGYEGNANPPGNRYSMGGYCYKGAECGVK